MKFWIFVTRSPVWWGALIRWITRSPWQHCGVGFEKPDGSRWYFEALVDYGVSGPRAFGDVERWAAKSKRRRFEVVALPCSEREFEDAWDECLRLQGVSSYSIRQLLRMWGAARLGIRVQKDETKLVCSEFASRIAILTGLDVRGRPNDLRDEKHRRHDEVTPGSAYVRAVEICGIARKE